MSTVSKWGMLFSLVFAMSQASAATVMQQTFVEHESTPDNHIANEHVVTRHSLAAHMGLTTEDVIFANPRNFRTESFNSEHIELEPLAADDDGTGS